MTDRKEMIRKWGVFVAQLMEDAAAPHTGNLQIDANAWPGSGITSDELVERLADFALSLQQDNSQLRELAKAAIEPCWSAASKLESQVSRDPSLPTAYRPIYEAAFESLRNLSEALRAESIPEQKSSGEKP